MFDSTVCFTSQPSWVLKGQSHTSERPGTTELRAGNGRALRHSAEAQRGA